MDTVKTLAEAVNEFHKPQGSTKKGRRDDLQKEFKEIAMSLFFGGYLKCGDKKIYVREAELYYYDEDNCCNAIKDESMFHTSNPIDPSLEKVGYFIAINMELTWHSKILRISIEHPF